MSFRRMSPERFLSDAELQAFMRAVRERRHVHQPRDHAFFALIANTGMRPSEVHRLTRADVFPHGRPPCVRLHRIKKRHAADPINDLVIHPEVAKVLAKYVDTLDGGRDERLFPFVKRQVARLFHYYADKAWLGPERRIYSLRHSVGMRLWRHTQDLRVMQAIMGHIRLKATSVYVHVSPERMREAHRALGTVE